MLDTLPSKYYLNHSRELFRLVADKCKHILCTKCKWCLSNTSNLTENAQCHYYASLALPISHDGLLI